MTPDPPLRVESPQAAIALVVSRLAAASQGLGCESVPLALARGRVLAEAICADRDSPPFDHSAMDGYAIRLADLEAGRELEVLAESRPGSPAPPMPATRGCVRVATGAPRPAGSDAVIRREDVREHPGAVAGSVARITITDSERPRPGQHWRLQGENARRGAILLDAGTTIDAAAAATLASCGISAPEVRSRVEVAVITTGDEVVPIDADPREEEIRNSNAAGLAALLAKPWSELALVEHVGDEFALLAEVLGRAIESHHAVILTGGVSMGHRDLVREAIEAQRAEILFHRLPQRPGRPRLAAIAGNSARSVPVFGLPGNPLSALTTARRIVLPTLAALAGATPKPPRQVEVEFDEPLLATPLWRFHPARFDGEGRVWLLPVRSSGDVAAAGRSDGFIEVPPECGVEQGRRYAFFAWDE